MNEQQKKDVERIKVCYQAETAEMKKYRELKKLDKKVEDAMLIPSLTLGILGALVLGGGMSLIMSYGKTIPGVAIGIVGIAILAISYPIGKYYRKRKEKQLKDRIYQLCNEIL